MLDVCVWDRNTSLPAVLSFGLISSSSVVPDGVGLFAMAMKAGLPDSLVRIWMNWPGRVNALAEAEPTWIQNTNTQVHPYK